MGGQRGVLVVILIQVYRSTDMYIQLEGSNGCFDDFPISLHRETTLNNSRFCYVGSNYQKCRYDNRADITNPLFHSKCRRGISKAKDGDRSDLWNQKLEVLTLTLSQ